MRVAAAHPLEIDAPAWAPEARDTEILAWAGVDPPACQRGTAFDRRAELRCPAKQKGGNARRLGSQLQPLRGGRRIFCDFADDPGETGVTKAFLHGEEHIGVAARFYMDQAVRAETRKMECGREEVAPAQTPENRPFGPRENAREKDSGARIVGQFGTSRNFVERASDKPAARQPRVDGIDAEGDDVMTRARAFDSRDFGAKIGEDGGLAHDIIRPGLQFSFPLCSLLAFRVKPLLAMPRPVERSCEDDAGGKHLLSAAFSAL